MAVHRGFIGANVVACYDEASGGGDMFDINAPRNAPAKSPASHLDKIIWHQDLFQYEIAAGPADVTINHTALAGKTTTYNVAAGGYYVGAPTPSSISFSVQGDTRETNIAVLAHGLGYVPKFMAALSGRRLPDGYIVQLVGGKYRRVSAWADATYIYLRESAVSGADGDALPAVSLTYRVMVFALPTPSPSEPMFGMASGILTVARGIIRTSRKYLRRTGSGDSPFAMNLGPTMDIKNGGSRTASGGVVVSEARYNGSMAAPPYISVGVD